MLALYQYHLAIPDQTSLFCPISNSIAFKIDSCQLTPVIKVKCLLFASNKRSGEVEFIEICKLVISVGQRLDWVLLNLNLERTFIIFDDLIYLLLSFTTG